MNLLAWWGSVWRGAVGQRRRGAVGHSAVWHGEDGQRRAGVAWRGEAGTGNERLGKAWQARHDGATHGLAGQVAARLGLAETG